jgi:succinylglutamate desuccinylase
MLLVLGGIRGNEPAGVLAARRVLAALQQGSPPLKGALHCFAGNLQALAKGSRYIDEDLNRIWDEVRMAADYDEGAPEPNPDMHEREDLRAALRAVVAEAPAGQEVHFLDLHTSSADGVPFICVGDTLRNRRFARDFPVPVLLGLEEQIDGALLEFLNNRGLVTMGFEGGKHDAPSAVAAHEAAIWIALGSAGMLPRGWPRVAQARRGLGRSRGGLPRILEVRHRHAIVPENGFVMRPGFRNFQLVSAGEVLADDREGPVRATMRARVLLPLYQGQGNDGFFLVRPVRRFWLELSRWMRILRMDRLAPLLPGVRRHPRKPDALLVNRRVARLATVQIFHLLGFRKRRPEGERWVFSRRAYDDRPPERFDLD